MTREETSDENNRKTGSYSYTDATGTTRTVRYVADENGFRATVETNEHGTKSHVAADAEYISSAPEYGPPQGAPPAKPVVVQAAPAPVVHAVVHHAPAAQVVHAAPVALVHAAHAAQPVALVHAGHAAPQVALVHAAHGAPQVALVHAAHAAQPVALVHAHPALSTAPVTLARAPLTYTLSSKAKSR